MLINMVLPGAVAAEEPFAFEYSGNFTDNRDADGKGTVRLNTSGTLTVTSGKATVAVYILGAGGGAAYSHPSGNAWGQRAGGGSGGYQTIEIELAPGTYEIIVGTGGLSVEDNNGNTKTGGTGGDTSAFGATSTGGNGGRAGNRNSIATGGSGGTPNGVAGSAQAGTSNVAGGSPNGGSVVNSVAQPGGDGLVRITFS